MAIRNRSFRNRRLRRLHPDGLTSRIQTITTPLDRPPSAPEFGSGVLQPGISRYQRNSAHLPSGVPPFRRIGMLPADAVIDLTSDDPAVKLSS